MDLAHDQLIALSRRLDGLRPDPCALYHALTQGRPDTLLFETADLSADGGSPARSVIVTRAALRATCRGRTVRLDALDANGRAALPNVLRALEGRTDSISRAHDAATVTFPPIDFGAPEAHRRAAPSPLDAARALTSAHAVLGAPDPLAPLAAGVFAYDLLATFEPIAPAGAPAPHDPLGFPDFELVLPDELVVLDHRSGSARVIALAIGSPAAYHDAARRVGELVAQVRAAPTHLEVPAPPEVSARVSVPEDQFISYVSDLKEEIAAGEVFQAVVSRAFVAPCEDPMGAYARLRRLNPSPYMFFVRGAEHTLLGASPETSVKVTRGRGARAVEIKPIAGTRRRGFTADGAIDADLDARVEAELRADTKELAEHMMLVDLARNDVARVSKPGTRRVHDLLSVERYSHVMHLVSRVTGELRDEVDALDAYAATLNMGTLVGAPKVRAAQLVHALEQTRRGPYGGAVGYVTHRGEMDTAIVIRSATVRDGLAYVRAGAGVVHDSDPAAEADETTRKARAVLTALGATEVLP
jgi:anthranilate synthase component 1